MKHIIFSLLLLLLSVIDVSAQGFQDSVIILNKAKADIQQLCSDEFAGRGYVGNGHQTAAVFIAKRFQNIGLKSGGEGKLENYFQPFTIQINLAEELSLELDGREIEVGEDVIVSKFSGSGKLNSQVIDMKYGLKPSEKVKGKIALFRAGWPKSIANSTKKRDKYKELSSTLDRAIALIKAGAEGIIIVQDKLTAGFTRERANLPIIELKTSALTAKVKTAKLEVKSTMSRISSQNIIGYIPGSSQADTAILITAHYDHLGQLENAIFTGANDNASGTSMILSMAEYFSNNPLKYTLVFIAFGGEETGLVGSNFYVNQQPAFPLEQSKFVLNLDLMANGIKGITAVGGKDYPAYLKKLQDINETTASVPVVRARPNAPNSDHYFFLKKGVPGFFIYTLGGPPHYHDVHDTASNLEYSRYVNVRNLLIQFLQEL
ncbi:MAG: M28 family peptidase [Bacteroidota bacterium]